MVGKGYRPVTGRCWSAVLLALGLLLAACGSNGDAPLARGAMPANAVFDQFATFYDAYGGEQIFGSTRTGPLFEAETGRTVQYFERFRLEYEPTRPLNDAVIVTPLGQWAYEAAPAAPAGMEEPPIVQEAFDQFFVENGREALFGAPLSPVMVEGERWVRYYENARFDWYPARSTARQVQLSVLGLAHYWQVGATLPALDTLSNIPDVDAGLRAAEVRATVSAPILYAGEQQRLTVYVSRETVVALSDVEVVAILLADGDERGRQTALTRGDGRVELDLDLSGLPPGEWVDVRIEARNGGQTIGTAALRFQIWW